VRKSTEPKSTDGGRKPGPTEGAGDYRILGVLYPADAPVWYFKFAGTAAQVTANEAEFDKVAKSVKLQASPTALPTFDLPAGWTRTGPRTVTRGPVTTKIDETLKFGTPAEPLELTITYIPGGGLLSNLDRWATQLGVQNFEADDIPKLTKTIDANGVKGLRVDMRGPKNPSAKGGPMMGALPPGHP
jgi:hypothetical protein